MAAKRKAHEPTTAAPLIPANPTLEKLRQAVRTCRACNLWERGTQTVFGEGVAKAVGCRLSAVGPRPIPACN